MPPYRINAINLAKIILNRPAKSQPELNEVAGGYRTVAIKVKDAAAAAQGQSKLDKIVGRDRAIAVGVAEHAEQAVGGRADDYIVVAAGAVGVAIELAGDVRYRSAHDCERVTAIRE